MENFQFVWDLQEELCLNLVRKQIIFQLSSKRGVKKLLFKGFPVFPFIAYTRWSIKNVIQGDKQVKLDIDMVHQASCSSLQLCGVGSPERNDSSPHLKGNLNSKAVGALACPPILNILRQVVCWCWQAGSRILQSFEVDFNKIPLCQIQSLLWNWNFCGPNWKLPIQCKAFLPMPCPSVSWRIHYDTCLSQHVWSVKFGLQSSLPDKKLFQRIKIT